MAANRSELGCREEAPKSDRVVDDIDIDAHQKGGFERHTRGVSYPAESTCEVSMELCGSDSAAEACDRIFEINVTNCRVKISHRWFRRFIRREDDQGDVANMSKAIDEAVAQFLVRLNETVLLYSASILKAIIQSVGTIKSVETIVQVKRKLDESEEQNQVRRPL